MPSRQPAVPEHRVRLVELRDPFADPFDRDLEIRRGLRERLRLVGRNSWSGGSSSRMVTGRSFISRKIPRKSSRCIGRIRSSGSRPPFGRLREDHLAHGQDAVLLEEHVLRPAESDPLRAEKHRRRARRGRVGVGAHAQPPPRVRPLQKPREGLREAGFLHRQRPVDDDLQDLPKAAWGSFPRMTSPVVPSIENPVALPSPRASSRGPAAQCRVHR
jgi:hypothetical protein